VVSFVISVETSFRNQGRPYHLLTSPTKSSLVSVKAGEAFNFRQCQNNVMVAGLTGNVSAFKQFIRKHVKA
jgi:hypothetical protein